MKNNNPTSISTSKSTSTPATKKYDAQKTLQQTLAAATKLFIEKGFANTSMMDIAKAAGLSKGALYHHFKSKEEIVETVKAMQKGHMEIQVAQWLSEANAKGMNAKEKLIHILHRNVEEASAHTYDAFFDSQARSPEFVVDMMHACVNESAPIFAALFKEGIADGSLQTDYPDECAELFFLLINLWCNKEILPCDQAKQTKRLKCLQSTMAALGIDIITDNLVERTVSL